MRDSGEQADKNIVIPCEDPKCNFYKDITHHPHHISTEISNLFELNKSLEHKTTAPSDVLGRDEAAEIIAQSMRTYEKHYCGKMK